MDFKFSYAWQIHSGNVDQIMSRSLLWTGKYDLDSCTVYDICVFTRHEMITGFRTIGVALSNFKYHKNHVWLLCFEKLTVNFVQYQPKWAALSQMQVQQHQWKHSYITKNMMPFQIIERFSMWNLVKMISVSVSVLFECFRHILTLP